MRWTFARRMEGKRKGRVAAAWEDCMTAGCVGNKMCVAGTRKDRKGRDEEHCLLLL